MRTFSVFKTPELSGFQRQALRWANQFSVVTVLLNNNYHNHLHQQKELLIAVGKKSELVESRTDNFENLKTFIAKTDDFIFGFLAYDLKNEIEKLKSENEIRLNFPLLYFFQPEILIEANEKEIKIYTVEIEANKIFAEILSMPPTDSNFIADSEIKIQQRTTKEEYLNNILKIQNHILNGDVYELNYCQEFFAEEILIDAVEVFIRMNEISPAPFACFYKNENQFLLCESPERFLMKSGNKIISQPIKGTAKRKKDFADDEKMKQQLLQSEKERAENVMIVDLVRNDLSRSCVADSVIVDELFGIYSYPNVHQMISTVSGELKKNIHVVDAIKNAFPMGSMTGAPKIAAMKLIEQYENFQRGIYSGTVGYYTPDKNFDFNVVIRSIMYNADKKYISFPTGGAITIDSIPENEWEECLLKAKSMMDVLQGRK